MAAIPAPVNGDLDARNCERKQRYTTELNARINAQAVINDTRPGRRHTPRRLWVYECPGCGCWHMSSNGGPFNRTAPVTSRELYAGSGR